MQKVKRYFTALYFILENLSAPHRANIIFYGWETTTALVLPPDQVTMEKATQNNTGVHYIAKYVTGSFNSVPYHCKVNSVLPTFNLARSSTTFSDNMKALQKTSEKQQKKALEYSSGTTGDQHV